MFVSDTQCDEFTEQHGLFLIWCPEMNFNANYAETEVLDQVKKHNRILQWWIVLNKWFLVI